MVLGDVLLQTTRVQAVPCGNVSVLASVAGTQIASNSRCFPSAYRANTASTTAYSRFTFVDLDDAPAKATTTTINATNNTTGTTTTSSLLFTWEHPRSGFFQPLPVGASEVAEWKSIVASLRADGFWDIQTHSTAVYFNLFCRNAGALVAGALTFTRRPAGTFSVVASWDFMPAALPQEEEQEKEEGVGVGVGVGGGLFSFGRYEYARFSALPGLVVCVVVGISLLGLMAWAPPGPPARVGGGWVEVEEMKATASATSTTTTATTTAMPTGKEAGWWWRRRGSGGSSGGGWWRCCGASTTQLLQIASFGADAGVLACFISVVGALCSAACLAAHSVASPSGLDFDVPRADGTGTSASATVTSAANLVYPGAFVSYQWPAFWFSMHVCVRAFACPCACACVAQIMTVPPCLGTVAILPSPSVSPSVSLVIWWPQLLSSGPLAS